MTRGMRDLRSTYVHAMECSGAQILMWFTNTGIVPTESIDLIVRN